MRNRKYTNNVEDILINLILEREAKLTFFSSLCGCVIIDILWR